MPEVIWQNTNRYDEHYQPVCRDECAIEDADRLVTGGDKLAIGGGDVIAWYAFEDLRRAYAFGGMAVAARDIDGAAISKLDYPDIHEQAEACVNSIRLGLCSRYETEEQACSDTGCTDQHLKIIPRK